jgi:hypothetical protein
MIDNSCEHQLRLLLACHPCTMLMKKKKEPVSQPLLLCAMHLLEEEATWASKRCKTYDMSENAV